MDEFTVPINEDRTSQWTYVVASRAQRCSEETSEMAKRCSEVYKAFDEFVVPLGVEYDIQEFPSDALVPTGDGDSGERQKTRKVNVFNENSLSLRDILEPFDQTTPSDLYVPRVRIPRTKVKFHFGDEERYVHRKAYSEVYRASEKLGRKPNKDPIEIELVHWPNREYPSIDEDFIFWIRVRTYSDLWFRETEFAQKNRTHLADFLRRLDSTLPVESVQRSTDYDTVSLLEDIF